MDKLYIEENKSSREVISNIALDYGLTNYEILKSKNGKPYFKDEKVYFNISNKDNVTVAIASDRPVGIDIEKLTFKEKVVKYFFTTNEQEIIRKSLNKKLDFTTIWVKKEAYLKCLGLDITSFREIDTTKLSGFILKNYKEYVIGIIKE